MPSGEATRCYYHMFVGVKVNVRKSYLAKMLIFVICDSTVRAVDTTMCSAHNFMIHEGRQTHEGDHNAE